MALTPGAFGGATVEVRGLRELVRAFQRFDRDLTHDMVDELAEAADPVRKLTEELILGEMEGIPATRYFSEMRIGVSRGQGLVYVAPEWRSNKGTPQGRVLARAERRRMERAVESKASEVEKRMGHFLDTLADEWGSHLAA